VNDRVWTSSEVPARIPGSTGARRSQVSASSRCDRALRYHPICCPYSSLAPFAGGSTRVGDARRHRTYCAGAGRHYLIGRYYDPQTGQFLSVDPLVDATGEPHAYAGDDLLNETDPSGMKTKCDAACERAEKAEAKAETAIAAARAADKRAAQAEQAAQAQNITTSANPAIAAEEERQVQAAQAAAVSAENIAEARLRNAVQDVGQAVSAGQSAGIPTARVLGTVGVAFAGGFTVTVLAIGFSEAVGEGSLLGVLLTGAAAGPLGLAAVGVGITIWAIWNA